MKRITVNALVDIGCLIMFIPSLISGLVLYFVLPEGGWSGERLDNISWYTKKPVDHYA